MIGNSRASEGEPRRLSTSDLPDYRSRLLILHDPADDAGLVDQIEELERIKSAAAAAQARLTDVLAGHRKTSRGDISAAAANEIGLARHESPYTGGRLTKLARALMHDLPETYACLCLGDINERRAQIVADETRLLCHEDRRQVDREISNKLAGLGDKKLSLAVRRIVLRIDEEAALKRRAAAVAARRVSGRLTGDGVGEIKMVVEDHVLAAIMRSLETYADSVRAAGEDARSRGQVMADEAAARLSGLKQGRPGMMLDLVVSSETLLGAGSTPGELPGVGPIPATVARALAAASDEVTSRMRRLFARPGNGALVAMESQSRLFPPGLRSFITIRDGLCRTPWCNAPVRHADHVEAASEGGETSLPNGQGLCEWCNYTKEASGWTHETGAGPGETHEVVTTTPTGHRHRSREPGAPVPPRNRSWVYDYVLAN